MSWNNTVTCSHCYNQGHNRRGCSKLKEYVVENPDSYTARRYTEKKASASKRACGYCKETGHNRKTCGNLKADVTNATTINRQWRNRVKDYMVNQGIGIGAIVQFSYDYEDNTLGMITGFTWDEGTFEAKSDSYKGGFVRVRPLRKLGSRQSSDSYLRLPTDCEEMPSSTYGRGRILAVVSPLAAKEVSVQIPSMWMTGATGISDMFDGKTHYSIPDMNDIAESYGIVLKRG